MHTPVKTKPSCGVPLTEEKTHPKTEGLSPVFADWGADCARTSAGLADQQTPQHPAGSSPKRQGRPAGRGDEERPGRWGRGPRRHTPPSPSSPGPAGRCATRAVPGAHSTPGSSPGLRTVGWTKAGWPSTRHSHRAAPRRARPPLLTLGRRALVCREERCTGQRSRGTDRQRDRPAAAGAAERGEETKDSRAISARGAR